MNVEQAILTMAGGMYAGLVTSLQEAGASPAASIRLAGFALLEEAFGPAKAWEVLGLPRSTAFRWQAEIKALDVSKVSQVINPDLINLFSSALLGGLNDE